jgi:hypothetical protein
VHRRAAHPDETDRACGGEESGCSEDDLVGPEEVVRGWRDDERCRHRRGHHCRPDAEDGSEMPWVRLALRHGIEEHICGSVHEADEPQEEQRCGQVLCKPKQAE